MRSTRVIYLAVAIAALCPLTAPLAAEELKLAWVETDDSVALTNHGKVVWQFNHGKDHRKPCFHPLATLDGMVLTDFRPSDHLWHRAAWFSLKEIDKLNYWEENGQGVSAGRNETIDVKIETQADFSAEIRLRQSYHPPDEPELLGEERVIQVSAPNEDGSYTLDWQHLFTARKAVTVGASAGYAGLSLRLSKQLLNWSFLNSEGQSEDKEVHGKGARWLTFKGPLAIGNAGLTIFDHPTNQRFPTKWFIVKGMPYFSPAFVFDGPMPLTKDQKFRLFYRMKVHGSAPEARTLEADYQTFANKVPDLAALNVNGEQIDLVAAGARLHQVYCGMCHSAQPAGESGKAGPKWYGLIGKSTRQREVLVKPAGVQSIIVDDEYIAKSIRQPNQHLAIRETAPQLGSAYPPSMPPYPHLTPQEVRSLIAFMKMLNEPENRGPQEVWEVKQAEPQLPVGLFEVVVKDRPLVYRVAMADVSNRALSVGLPGGYNYIFDPSTFSVKQAWAGGFLNLKTERTGRGAGYNHFGAAARDIGFVECFVPLGKSGPINQGFKDYINNQAWRIEKSKAEMKETTAFIDRKPPEGAQFGGYRFDGVQAPTFLFRINDVDYEQQIAFESDQVMHYYFATTGATEPVRFRISKDKILKIQTSAGVWDGDTLSIPAKDAAEFYITLVLDPSKAKPLPIASNNPGAYDATDRLVQQMRKLGLDRRTNFAKKAKAISAGGKDGGAIGPQGAVDGSPHTYWDETNSQKTYSLNLTLAKPHPVSAATLLGYKHHDYAPKSFELIVNGKTVKTVADAKYDNNLLLVEFPRTQCHTLELKVTSYYGQSPAVRELGLYDLEETPAPDSPPFVRKWTLEELAADADMTSQRTTEQGVKRGMIAFLKAGCVKCHPIGGQGARNGPDLTKVASQHKGRKLLQQILEPSSELNKDFLTWQIVTSDGRVVVGLIVDDDGKTLSVMPKPELPETIVHVVKKDVEKKAPTKVSSMPTEAVSTLTREEILDLLAYLEAGGIAAGK